MAQFKTALPAVNDIPRTWWVVDAEGLVLGRLASEIALRLRGKHKPIYTPHMDTGDYIIVVNADKVAVTGNKEELKLYQRHTGYPGGIKTRTLGELREKFPERVVEHAVKGMLPKGPLGRQMYRKLHVYAGADHPHSAQQPQPLDLPHVRVRKHADA